MLEKFVGAQKVGLPGHVAEETRHFAEIGCILNRLPQRPLSTMGEGEQRLLGDTTKRRAQQGGQREVVATHQRDLRGGQ